MYFEIGAKLNPRGRGCALCRQKGEKMRKNYLLFSIIHPMSEFFCFFVFCFLVMLHIRSQETSFLLVSHQVKMELDLDE